MKKMLRIYLASSMMATVETKGLAVLMKKIAKCDSMETVKRVVSAMQRGKTTAETKNKLPHPHPTSPIITPPPYHPLSPIITIYRPASPQETRA